MIESPLPPVRHVFVGGLHRSGTTLVARLLADHPAASGFSGTGVPGDEGQHLQDVMRPARDFGGPGRFGFRSGVCLVEPPNPDELRARLMASWGPRWDLSRPVLVEKSPPNLLRFRYLQAVFPDSAFVAVRRHPVAVALATQRLRRRGRLQSLRSLIGHWLVCHRRYEADRPSLRRVIDLRYEDLIADPEGELRRVQRACGLSERPPTIDISSEAQRRYQESWRRWCRRPGARRRLRSLEGEVASFGYLLDDLQAP